MTSWIRPKRLPSAQDSAHPAEQSVQVFTGVAFWPARHAGTAILRKDSLTIRTIVVVVIHVPFGGTLANASGNGVDLQSGSAFPLPGVGAGAGINSFDTNTNIVSWNWVQHL